MPIFNWMAHIHNAQTGLKQFAVNGVLVTERLRLFKIISSCRYAQGGRIKEVRHIPSIGENIPRAEAGLNSKDTLTSLFFP